MTDVIIQWRRYRREEFVSRFASIMSGKSIKFLGRTRPAIRTRWNRIRSGDGADLSEAIGVLSNLVSLKFYIQLS